jgi:hypothetical protein
VPLSKWPQYAGQLQLSTKASSTLEVGKMLVVTSKHRLQLWADCVRSLHDKSLHVYADDLSARRRRGIGPLTRVDVVVTSFDVLRSKEVGVCEQADDDEGGSEDKENELVNNDSHKWVKTGSRNIPRKQ